MGIKEEDDWERQARGGGVWGLGDGGVVSHSLSPH